MTPRPSVRQGLRAPSAWRGPDSAFTRSDPFYRRSLAIPLTFGEVAEYRRESKAGRVVWTLFAGALFFAGLIGVCVVLWAVTP